MLKDPRFKNQIFAGDTLQVFAQNYVQNMFDAFQTVDLKQLEAAYALILKARQQGQQIFVIGNGGSAAIADHLCCDWTKGTAEKDLPHIKTQSLAANVPMMTAISNDFGFEYIFAKQLEFLAHEGDILVAISSSGNSQNILSAVEVAHAKKMTVIGMTGFKGGKLNAAADIPLHVNIENYGAVEDLHQMLMHILAQYIAKQQS